MDRFVAAEAHVRNLVALAVSDASHAQSATDRLGKILSEPFVGISLKSQGRLEREYAAGSKVASIIAERYPEALSLRLVVSRPISMNRH